MNCIARYMWKQKQRGESLYWFVSNESLKKVFPAAVSLFCNISSVQKVRRSSEMREDPWGGTEHKAPFKKTCNAIKHC